MIEKESQKKQKLYAAFGTIFRLVRISKEASRNFKLIFLFADDLKHDLASMVPTYQTCNTLTWINCSHVNLSRRSTSFLESRRCS
jgi:hypothetical protein